MSIPRGVTPAFAATYEAPVKTWMWREASVLYGYDSAKKSWYTREQRPDLWPR